MGGMESCVSQHYVTPGATSLPMGEYVQVPPDMGGHPCTPAMSSYLESLPPGVGMPEYPWMKEKKTVRKPAQQGESPTTRPRHALSLRAGGRGGTAGVNQVCAGGRREGGKRLGGDHVCFARRPEKSSAASGGGRNGGLLLFSTCSLVCVPVINMLARSRRPVRYEGNVLSRRSERRPRPPAPGAARGDADP